jgi:PPK2 family polyphosphate:nucleotide phosphotransferase
MGMNESLYLPQPVAGEGFTLRSSSCVGTPSVTKEYGKAAAEALMADVTELEALMFGAATHRVVLVLQGLDASGKDGVVRFVIGRGDPVTSLVTSFKMPTPAEAGRDFLWRVHNSVPPRGMLGIFNRSHYEDVVATRVRDTIDAQTQAQRIEHITAFESLLTDDGTILIKCYLHIDADEQSTRLLAREHELITAWKLAPDDWHDRGLFESYLDVYSDVMLRTSTDRAPWYVVPANRKWYRNLVIAGLLKQHMEPYRAAWAQTLQQMQTERIAAIEAVRQRSTGGTGR